MRPFVNRCRRQETHELLTMLSWTRTGTRTRTWPPPRTKFIHITTNTTSHLCLTIFSLFLKPLEVIVQHFSQLVLCQNPCSSRMSRFTCHSACCFEIQVAQQQLLNSTGLPQNSSNPKTTHWILLSKRIVVKSLRPAGTSRM